jgi:hypothetical protein
MKPTIVLAFVLFGIAAMAQDDLSGYLSNHRYSFTLDKGFGGPLADTLHSKLADYRLILEAEGGSHYLKLYERLELIWLEFLQARMGLVHFVGEAGTSNVVLINRFLETGDTSAHYIRKTAFFEGLLRYNAGLPQAQRLKMSGIDFERASTYIRGLKVLLPAGAVRATSAGAGPALPGAIGPSIALIRDAPDTGYDCDAVLGMNDRLKKALAGDESAFRDYFGSAFGDFERIVRNNGTCKDGLRNRNGHMADNFLALDREVKAPVYYGEFGEAHTILKNRDLASIINESGAFKGKVAVINLYCYDCSTPEEPVSNWPLHDIEKDILRYFLPLCEGDFTLFDLSGDSPLVGKYRAYGQFLIVAKGQH